MANNISKYHGPVRPCDCGIYNHPEKQGERACRVCFGRGFVAECMACGGKGKHEVPVNGHDPALGVMSSTCNICGGMSCFGVNKPADWVDAKPEEAAPAPTPAALPEPEEKATEEVPEEPAVA